VLEAVDLACERGGRSLFRGLSFAPRVILGATHESVLDYVPLSALKRYALDLN